MTIAKILVVEDDPEIVIFIVDQLEYLGYQVDVARDGEDGLEKANSLLHWQLRKDGEEIFRRHKA